MIYMNGPGSPSAFFHPILLGEYQADWILRAIDHLRETGAASIEPDPKAEESYVAENDALTAQTLFPAAKSWYMGDNIPGNRGVCSSTAGASRATSSAARMRQRTDSSSSGSKDFATRQELPPRNVSARATRARTPA
jgi:hypothetical protein